MSDFIELSFPSFVERCLDEGLPSEEEHFDLIEAGEADFPGEPELAVHEAGHAVAACVLGRPIVSVSSEEWDEASKVYEPDGSFYHVGSPNGVVRYADEPELTGPDFATRLYRDAVTAAGGPLAQHVYAEEPIEFIMRRSLRHADPNSSSDWHLINNDWICSECDIMFPGPPFEMPEQWSDEDHERFFEWYGEQMAEVMRKLWVEAERIVQENWDLLSGLAAVLISRPWLTCPEVYEVFARIEARRAAAA